ncbi:hypothetical protein N3930_35225 [Bacillus thuringiensis]|nr:hypothetical protein [Bacillus thuringiensis]
MISFKEVDCEADIVKVEDEIFENNDVQTHLSEITIHVTGKNIGYRSVSASIFIVLVTISIPLLISLEDKYADEKETENL